MTMLICASLLIIGASSVIGAKMDLKRNLEKPLIRFSTQKNSEEDIVLATGGFLSTDIYDIEIISGSAFQVKRLKRALNNDVLGFFKMVKFSDIDLKITYKKTMITTDDSTEVYASCAYTKDGLSISEESKIKGEPHTLIIKGFTGNFLKIGSSLLDEQTQGLENFFFVGNFESYEISLID